MPKRASTLTRGGAEAGWPPQKIHTDAGSRRELAGLVASTHYAGELDDVNAVAYAPDGVLATSDGSTVSLWNTDHPASPVRLGMLSDAGELAGPQAFSPDGRTLVVVGLESDPVLWDVSDRAHPVRVATLTTEYGAASAAFSPDGHTVGAYDGIGNYALWDVTDPARPSLLTTIADDDRPSAGLAFSPDGRTMVTASDPSSVWDIADRSHPQLLATLDDPGASPTSLAFSPHSPELAVGRSDGTVSRWDLQYPENPHFLYRLTGTDGGVSSVVFSSDGRLLAAGDEQGKTTLWDVSGPEIPWRLASMPGIKRHAWTAFSPDGGTLATAAGGRAILWRTTRPIAPDRLVTMPGYRAQVDAVAYGPDGTSMATDETDGTTLLWDVRDPAHPVRRATLSTHGPASWVAFSADGRTVAAAQRNGQVTLTDVTDPTHRTVIDPPSKARYLVLSPDGRTLATVGSTVTLWDLATSGHPTQLAVLDDFETTSPRSVAFSPDSRTITGSDRTNSLVLWDITDRSAPVRLSTGATHLKANAVAFSPVGHTLATDNTLWDVTDRAHPHLLTTLTDGFAGQSLAFSPDGRTFAAATAPLQQSGTSVIGPSRSTRPR